ncbi:hypothetical protein GCM10010191_85200 [Actinomadura vinacea]|uniref:Toxin-antitoxin system HicB family antitoxin n=1 Tax=Actinomadura vinacea TaxID=115336 RepID=A0ABP5XJE8_9ACTN
MDVMPYVDRLRRELAVAAAAGSGEARELAERLTAPLESAARLALLEALSAAADEITRELAPGSVEVRMRGLDPDFIVTPPPVERLPEAAHGSSLKSALARSLEVTMGVRPPVLPAPPEGDEGGGTSRVTLRLPEHLKPRVEEAAGRAGLSVNAWLVRTVAAALGPDVATGDASGRPYGNQHTGWVS